MSAIKAGEVDRANALTEVRLALSPSPLLVAAPR